MGCYELFKETENVLADDSGGYKNINVVRKFSRPDQDLLRYVHDGIVPGMAIRLILAISRSSLLGTHTVRNTELKQEIVSWLQSSSFKRVHYACHA